MGVTSKTAQQHQNQWFPPRSEHLDGRNPQRPEQHQTEHLTHAEAQFEFLSPQKWKQLSEKK